MLSLPVVRRSNCFSSIDYQALFPPPLLPDSTISINPMAYVHPDIVGNSLMAMARALSRHSNTVSPLPDIPAVDATVAV